jgi:hypothetical protein
MKNYFKNLIQFLLKCSQNKKILKFKTLFICVLIIVLYVSLNNYLIMFIYFDNSAQRSTLKEITSEISTDRIHFDSQDLVFESFKKSSNQFLIEESYFGNDSVPRPCIHPKLDPFDKEILKFVVPERIINCNPKQNWVTVENASIVFSPDAVSRHGSIICAYIPLYRGDDDFKVHEGTRIFPIVDRMPLITDFFKVDCRSKDGAIYSNIHSGIAYDPSLMMRPVWNPMNKQALGYNVLMLGFDSVSRMSFIRLLPKTYEYIVKELGIVILKGYNIVGDGTPQALLPILTGKAETELPEARRGFVNASYVDAFPWIWNDYKKNGYVTQV